MTIMFDFDEVFVDTMTGSLDYINEKLGTSYTHADVKAWDFFDDPAIRPAFVEYLSLPDVYQTRVIPNLEMINACKQLIDMGEDVYIVTASLEGSHESKLQFIRDHMKFISEDRVFVVNSTSKYKHKSDVLNDLPLNYRNPIVLVDDGIHNVLDMMADIRHKEKLDRTMKQFYSNKLLKKFNNRYHDFIYGIVPELVYNQALEDGKRIFKIKETKDIWKVLKNIEDSHAYRVASKEFEIFDYLNNIVSPLTADRAAHMGTLKHNFEYLMHYCYAKRNPNTEFLTEVGKLVIGLNQAKHTVSDNKLASVFDNVDSLFNSVMYDDIRSLAAAHVLPNAAEVSQQKALADYKLVDAGGNSVLSTLLNINERNVTLVEGVLKHLGDKDVKQYVNTILFNPHTGINNIDCLSDANYIKSNLLLILNKNCDVRDNEVKPVYPDIEAVVSVLSERVKALNARVDMDMDLGR